MIPLYKNNYLRPIGHGQDFTIEIDPLPSKFNNLYVESCRAAEELYDLKQGKVHIMYSGGIDSEHCLSVFLSLGMDVTPVIIRLNPGYNDHDTKFAFKFCREKNLNPLVIGIDYDDFVESGKLLRISQEMKSSTFGRAHVAYAASMLDGTVILGDGEPYLELDKRDNTWYMIEEEHDFSIYNYFKIKGIHGTAHFNRFTPGMFAAHMLDPIMTELVNNQHNGRLSNNGSRHIVYNRHSNFNLMPRYKFHGFEYRHQYKIFSHPAFAEIHETCQSYNGHIALNYHNFIKQYIYNE
jgi:hypothetical protein